MQGEGSLTARKRIRQGERPTPAENDGTTPDTQPTSSHQQKVAQDKPRIVAESSSPSSGSHKESRWTRIRGWCVRWEVARKLLHTSIGFVTLHEWSRGTTSAVKISLGLGKALVVITAADLLRFRWPKFARFYQRCLGFLMRPSERNSWNGVIFYLLGVITSLLTLPLDISVLSILILSWVDTAASVIGRRYGTEGTRLPSPPFARRKSIAGFMGAFGVGSMTALGFWWRWAGQGRLSRGERYSWGPLEAATALLPRQYRDSPPFTLHQHHAFHPLLLKLKLKLPTPNANLTISSLSIACGLVAAIAESFDCFGCDDNLLLPVLSGWGIWAIMLSFSY